MKTKKRNSKVEKTTKKQPHKKILNQIGCLKGGEGVQLSDIEREILHLLTVERLTPKQASIRRKCSVQNIYKYRKRLQEGGYLDSAGGAVENIGGRYQPAGGADVWRLHAVEARIKILGGHLGEKYVRARGTGNGQVRVRDSTILLYRDVLHIKCGVSFVADHARKCEFKMGEYLIRLLAILENDLGLILVKPRATNIHVVKGECGRMNDLLGHREGAGEIIVYDRNDGKPCWRVDWSPKSIPETEAVHPYKHIDHAELYEAFLDDLTQNPPLLSDIASMARINAEQISQITTKLNDVASALSASVELQKSVLMLLKSQNTIPSVEDDRRFADYYG